MTMNNRTVPRQMAVIADFFGGDLSQADILTKHRVSEETYRKWQFDTAFTDEMDRRIAAAHRESAAIIARCAPLAAGRLIELTKSPKEEIARRACLDIISFGKTALARANRVPTVTDPDAHAISPEAASKILAALVGAAGCDSGNQ